MSALESYAVAPLFKSAGSGISLRNISLKQLFPQLISKLSSGYFWRNVGIFLGLIAADILFTESAFYSLRQTSSELNSLTQYRLTPEYAKTKGTLQDDVNIEQAIKSRDLLREIIGIELTEDEKKELEKNKDEIYNISQERKQELKKVLEEHGWGESLTHREAVVALYALEYIRTEMADMSDRLRYREAAMDISQIYSSGRLPNLHKERLELFNLLEEAHEIAMQEMAKNRMAAIENLDGSILNVSGGKVGYFRAGHK